jgi:hypothetical protein
VKIAYRRNSRRTNAKANEIQNYWPHQEKLHENVSSEQAYRNLWKKKKTKKKKRRRKGEYNTNIIKLIHRVNKLAPTPYVR